MQQSSSRLREVLFLGTDNHYRSRYAEIIFNHAARLGSIPWRARSRGLVLDLMHRAPVSPWVVARLRRLNIELPTPLRWPAEVGQQDLRCADTIIALDLTEHRPLVRCRHLSWDLEVTYWEIGDLDVVPPDQALGAIDQSVIRLVRLLARAA